MNHWLVTVCTVILTLQENVNTQHKYRGMSSRTVSTRYGVIRGVIIDSSPPVEAFLGVPYAAPPVGPLRFMHPVTPRGWPGVYVADSRRPICPQMFDDMAGPLVTTSGYLINKRLSVKLLRQSEDCLYLNIYAPVVGKSTFIAFDSYQIY